MWVQSPMKHPVLRTLIKVQWFERFFLVPYHLLNMRQFPNALVVTNNETLRFGSRVMLLAMSMALLAHAFSSSAFFLNVRSILHQMLCFLLLQRYQIIPAHQGN